MAHLGVKKFRLMTHSFQDQTHRYVAVPKGVIVWHKLRLFQIGMAKRSFLYTMM